MNAMEQYFYVVLFIVVYKVVLTVKATDETLVKVKNDHRSKFSNLSNWKEEA